MGPMTPQGPNPYAQMFNAQRGAQQPQGMPPMRPQQMMGQPPTGQAGPQQVTNPYAAMLQQARPQMPPGGPMGGPGGMPGMQMGQRPPWAGGGQGGPQGMGQGMDPAMMQQRMQLAQQMAQQGRPQMGGMPQQAQDMPQRPMPMPGQFGR